MGLGRGLWIALKVFDKYARHMKDSKETRLQDKKV